MAVNNERALEQKERELQLLLALDEVRDAFEDPESLFETVVKLVKKHFEAEACAMLFITSATEDDQYITAAGLTNELAYELCREAMTLSTPSPLTTTHWPHTLGIQIVLDEKPLGGLFIARSSRPFNEIEMALLKLTESQLDSAIVQARMVWRTLDRTRELEAIYEIDRLRDFTVNEADLVSGFTTILLQRFQADLCIIMLNQIESGELLVRGLVDKYNLSPEAISRIRENASHIEHPQVIPTPDDAQDLRLLAAPFIVAHARLGAVVVGRKQAFTSRDKRLLEAMISQMDSAIVHSRVSYQLAQRNKELEIIYRIDHIRDVEHDFDTMLQKVLGEICKVVSGELGFIILYRETEEQQIEIKSFTIEGSTIEPEYYNIIRRFARECLARGYMLHANEPQGVVHSIIAAPLILNAQVIGVFGVANSTNSGGFTAEDRRVLSAITSQVDTAVFERLEQRRMRSLLSRSVDPKVLEHLLRRADPNVLSGERVVLSILFADLRGSTEWAERIKPEELVSTINIYMGRMTEIIFKYGGTLDKFVGDEVIGLFGTPLMMNDHASRAAQTALEMQIAHKTLQDELYAQGRELPDMGIGISSGEAIAGEFGTTIRADFTAMGRIVNLGSRLCGVADAGQVIISQATYDMIKTQAEVRLMPPFTLKGISQPTPVYELLKFENQMDR